MILEPQAKWTLENFENLMISEPKLSLSARTQNRVKKASAQVQKLARSRDAIYGVNTGFGKLAQIRVSTQDLQDLQINLLRSHACGIGNPLSPSVVKRILALRVLSLGKAYSGISLELLKRHLEYWNQKLIPWIPEQGSVGASGDLAPLAYLGLTFMGEGYFMDRGRRVPAMRALRKARLKPLSVLAKEGLALVNGTQVSLALALEARASLVRALEWLPWIAALSVEAHRGTDQVFRADLHRLKAHPHQQAVASKLFKILHGSSHMKDHASCDLVQDSYSFRCIPQIVGPVLEIFESANRLLEGEMNSVTDNPVLLPSGELVSGGHFHAQSVALACDQMALGVVTLSNLIERRIDQLIHPGTTRQTPFFATAPGVESGLMIVQTAAAAIASENKTLAHPASADTIPTNGNQEDHVSMAPWAARKLQTMISNLWHLLGAELVVATRGCILESTQSSKTFAPALSGLLRQLSRDLPQLFKPGDRFFGDDWARTREWLLSRRPPR